VDILSPYILAAAIGWIVAHLLKLIIQSVKAGRLKSVKLLYLSGGMPSSHSATTVALLVVVGFKDGVGSAIFGLAFLFAMVVMYDALMLRRSSGEQGQSLTALIKEQKSKVHVPRVAKGHTPLEVLGGAVVGVVIGLLVYALTQSW
jgi:acid phosphatase family membrane protein YuiD